MPVFKKMITRYCSTIILLSCFSLPSLSQTNTVVIGDTTGMFCHYFNPALLVYSTHSTVTYYNIFNSFGADLNSDGSNDLSIYVGAAHQPNFNFGLVELQNVAFPTQYVVQYDSIYLSCCDFPAILAPGLTLAEIIPSYSWNDSTDDVNLIYDMASIGGNAHEGLWDDSTVHFLGFRQIEVSDTVYGWIEMEIGTTELEAYCSIKSICFQHSLSFTTALPEIEKNESLLVFNSLVQDQLYLKCGNDHELEVKVFSLNGLQIIGAKFYDQQAMNLSFLSPGMYVCRFTDLQSGEIQMGKIFKL